jgi:hypothetical protein
VFSAVDSVFENPSKIRAFSLPISPAISGRIKRKVFSFSNYGRASTGGAESLFSSSFGMILLGSFNVAGPSQMPLQRVDGLFSIWLVFFAFRMALA